MRGCCGNSEYSGRIGWLTGYMLCRRAELLTECPLAELSNLVEALTSTLASPQADDSVIQLRRPLVFVCQ